MPIVRSLKQMISRRRPPAADAGEAQRLVELRAAIAALPDLGPAPASPAAAEWLDNRRRLRELLATEDPRRFLEWDVIQKTMFVGNNPAIRTELAELQASPEWSKRWKPALLEDTAGCPPRFRWRLSSSGNLIHHAFNLLRGEALLERKIDRFSRIIEFGGGYGSFCRLAWRLGSRGKYVIFDLPEFGALQRYFLRSVGVPTESPDGKGVRFMSELSDLAAETNAARGGLFIAQWSLSETPLEFRKTVLSTLAGAMDGVFIAYQDRFGEVDNRQFFADWTASQPRFRWRESAIAHFPGNQYLVGTAI